MTAGRTAGCTQAGATAAFRLPRAAAGQRGHHIQRRRHITDPRWGSLPAAHSPPKVTVTARTPLPPPSLSIAGHVPEMVLYNIEGAEADRINVEGKTFSEMQALMANLGFHSKAEMVCESSCSSLPCDPLRRLGDLARTTQHHETSVGVRFWPARSDLQAIVAVHPPSQMAAGGHRAGAHWELRDFMHIPNLFSHTGVWKCAHL